MKRTIILPALITAFVALSPAGVALADNAHNGNTTGTTTGQPNQSAEEQTAEPRGFTTGDTTGGPTGTGFANAETHYAAGTDQGKNPKAVSQYDVAAFQFSHKGP
jgi:hypothetical protein